MRRGMSVIQTTLVPKVERCPCSTNRMDAASIVSGNVCGRFRDVLARKVLVIMMFSAGTLTTVS